MNTPSVKDGSHLRSAVAHPRSTLDSGDGILSFELTRSPVGLHVKRTHCRAGGQVDCSTVFHDEARFVRWVDADQMRFAYPLLFQQLRRSFSELIGQGSQHDAFFA
jgi:hypothetical protein